MKLYYISAIIISAFIFGSCDDNTDEIGSSLIGNMDDLEIIPAKYNISTSSIIADSVYSRNTIGYLGKIRDPETGAYITSDFTTQFHTLENYEFPDKDSIRSLVTLSDDSKEIIADSCELRLYFDNYYGDSLSTMKVTAYELQTPMSEGEKYYSNYDPIKDGLIRTDGIKINKLYTLSDQNVDESVRGSSNYTANIRIKLDKEYTDKDGKKYNNFGTYLMRKYYENPSYFKDSYTFIHNLVPGYYFKIQSGLGSMAYIRTSQLNVYFRFLKNDSVVVGASSFVGTEEVIQSTRIANDANTLKRLVEDKSCTYIKSPAGIFTELTIPVDDIMNGHRNDTINTAKIVLPRINNTSQSEYTLDIPQTLLMIPAEEIHSFFEEGRVVDYKTSFIALYDSKKNSYTFNNISTLVKAMDQKDRSDSKWNKAVIIPVTVTYNTDGEIIKVAHDMSMTSTRLVGGSENPYEPLTIDVIYSKFK
ncbi:MAG: hypothetical protein BHV84_02065 [Prevotella sp. AG:487_50_53]|jgi:hypothetical protein|nr:MAG: hypothetical protein BHV84_02065 [Prevotella sp. AG:487_50_53]